MEEPRSGLTRRLPWRSRHIRILGGSCRISQGAPIDIARRSTVERRVRAHIVVKVEPGADHVLCIASIGQFVQVHRLVLQRPPQPLDEDVVEIAAAAVHGAACASRAYPVGERVAGKLGTLVRVEYLRGAGMQRRLERVDAENAVHRVRQPPRQDMAAGPVHHGDEIKKAIRNRDIGDVSTPRLVRPIDHQVAQQVGIHPVLRVGHAGARLAVDCLHRHQAHQPPHPVPPADHALATQMAHHLPTAVERIRKVQLVKPAHQCQVLRTLAQRRVVLRRPAHV